MLIVMDYQQQVVCSGSEITSDSSLKPLKMIYVVVMRVVVEHDEAIENNGRKA
jgi:hypothetical protein